MLNLRPVDDHVTSCLRRALKRIRRCVLAVKETSQAILTMASWDDWNRLLKGGG